MKAIYKLDVDDMTSIIADHFKVDKNYEFRYRQK